MRSSLDVVSRRLLISAVAAIAATAVTVIPAIWELSNAPKWLADGSISDGAEKGAYLYLNDTVIYVALACLCFWFLIGWLPRSVQKISYFAVSLLLAGFAGASLYWEDAASRTVLAISIFVASMLMCIVGDFAYRKADLIFSGGRIAV